MSFSLAMTLRIGQEFFTRTFQAAQLIMDMRPAGLSYNVA